MTNPWGLSKRQGDILEALARGVCIKQIAKDQGISFRTVQAHVYRVAPKMGAANTMHAVVMWDRHVRANESATASR